MPIECIIIQFCVNEVPAAGLIVGYAWKKRVVPGSIFSFLDCRLPGPNASVPALFFSQTCLKNILRSEMRQ